jgi:hypothetical protein
LFMRLALGKGQEPQERKAAAQQVGPTSNLSAGSLKHPARSFVSCRVKACFV